VATDATPFWKRGQTPQARAAQAASRRAKTSVKHALENAFDLLGNEAFFVQLGRGSAEDKRCLAMILAKLLPLEIAGSVDHSLVVKIVRQVGDREVVINTKTAHLNPPRDAVTGKALPVAPHRDERPTNPMPEIEVALED
jgi:hypothetical protein